jgi:autotransporter-associated beta strand protein
MLRAASAVVAASLTFSAQSSFAQSDPVGYAALLASFSAADLPPPGTNIVVEQVEAIYPPSGSNAYLPDNTRSNFNNVTITNLTTSETGTFSDHATTVASVFYGTSGYASGVSKVDVYEANDWLINVLKIYSGSLPASALTPAPAVANFSWIGSYGTAAVDNDALRRLDYVINRDNLVAVVGVNNGSGSAIPALLASGYNSIAVGLSSGQSSLGPVPTASGVDGPGRSKPDIVAPSSATSFATPQVSAAAAMLEQVARSKATLSSGTNAAVIKAILLASTDKNPLATWSHTATQPLDPQYGAGQLNFDWAYQIVSAGPQTAGTTSWSASTGWSYSSVTPATSSGSTQTFYFTVPSGQPFDLSALLTWQRKVTPLFSNSGSLATINLNLYQANSNFTLGSLIDSSSSSIDNVQYVFDRGLAPGTYALQVKRTDSLPAAIGSFALAWQMQAVPYWIAADGSWNNAANWNNDLVAGGIGREAALFAPTSSGINITLDALQTVGLLTLANTASANTGYTIGAGAGGSLTFSNSGSSAQLNITSGSHVITAPVVLDSNLIVSFAAGAAIGISGNVSGAGGLTLTGAGTTLLSGSNSYAGGTSVNAGNLVFASPSSIPGSGTILISGSGALNVTGAYSTVGGWLASGKISSASNGALALTASSNENINMAGYPQLSLGAASPGTTYSGVLTPAGSTYYLGGGGGSLTFTPNLTGARSLVVDNPGTLILTGTNTYTGGTTVTDGTLKITSPASIPGGSLNVGNNLAAFGLSAPPLAPVSAVPGAGDSAGLPAVLAGVTSVPEPSALLLTLAAGVCALLCRAARQR